MAESRALAAALIFRFGLPAGAAVPLIFAHLARAPAAMAARPAALMWRFLGAAVGLFPVTPLMTPANSL